MKRIDRLTEIKNIYKRFYKAEKEILIANIRGLESSEIKGYEKASELIKLISVQPAIGINEVLQILGKSKDSIPEQQAFLRTIKELLLENLSLNINAERPKNLSNRIRIANSNAKKLSQARILLSRNNQSQAVRLLEDVANKGMKYELFQDSIEAYKQLQFTNVLEKGIKPYKRISGYISEAKQLADAYDQAQDIYLQYLAVYERNNLDPDKKAIANYIQQLEEIYRVSKVNYAKYLLELLRSKYLVRAGDFAKAKIASEKLLETIKSEPAIETEQREGLALLDYTEILSEIKKYDEARIKLKDASRLFKKNSFEAYTINKRLCLLDFYQKNYSELDVRLKKIIQSKYTLRWPFAIAQFTYYTGVLNYLKGKYSDAAGNFESIKDGTGGFNLELKFNKYVMMYITGIVLQKSDHDVALRLITEAVRNLEDIYNSDQNLPKRSRIIVRIIRRLEGYDRNFQKTQLYTKDSLARLTLQDDDHRIKIFSDEIIPFSNIFMAAHATNGVKVRKKRQVTEKA
jgi:tetratricopeptide (TPR) repeat protein